MIFNTIYSIIELTEIQNIDAGVKNMNVKTLYVVPTARYSIGSTQHPYSEKETQRRILDSVLSLIGDDESFRWTCSSASVVCDYLRGADELTRKTFFSAVENGFVEVCGFGYDHASFMSDITLMKSVETLDCETWKKLGIKSVMQIGVGGVNSGAVKRACEKGARYLWVGADEVSSQMKQEVPFVFNWRVSVKDKTFTWVDSVDNNLFSLLLADKTPKFSGFDAPSAEKILCRILQTTDKDELVLMSARLCSKIEEIEKRSHYGAAAYPVLYTGGAGYNNAEAILSLPSFIKTWNNLGLIPRLEIATLSAALCEVEKEITNTSLRSLTGEWSDGINQAATMPRETALLRDTERKFRAALTLPAFNAARENRFADSIATDLCVFSERTYRADERLLNPDAADTFNYKRSRLSLAAAKTQMLYTDRIKSYFEQSDSGIVHVYNTCKAPYRGLVRVPVTGLPSNSYCAVNTATAHTEKLTFRDGYAFFYADIPQGGIQTLRFSDEIGADVASIRIPTVTVDELGCPTEVVWGDVKFSSTALGEFCAVCTDSETKRDVMNSLYSEKDSDMKNSLVRHYSIVYQSVFGQATKTEDSNFIRFEQPFTNDRLVSGTRTITVWKKTERITVDVVINRRISDEPESFYLKFLLDSAKSTAVSSMGGRVFEVGRGQLDFSNFDATSIDGWIAYPYDDLLFTSKDAPVMCFGGANYFAGLKAPSSDHGCLFSCVFNNTYNTGCNRTFGGAATFTYDIFAGIKTDDFTSDKAVFAAAYTQPVVYSEF